MPSVASLGSLIVTLGAKTKNFESDLDNAEKKLKSTELSMRSVVNRAGKLGVAATAAGAAIIAGLVRSGIQAINTNRDLARALDGTVDGVRGLQIAAADVGLDGLEGSLNRLNRRLGAVEMGGGPAADAVKALNLNLDDLRKMDVDQRVAAIADAVQDFSGTNQEAARHLQNLGFEQADAINFFRQGGDAIRAARREVDEYGLSVSEIDAEKISQAGTAMSRLGRIVEVIRTSLTVKLAPFLTEIAERFNKIAKENQGWRSQIERVIETGIRGFGKFLDVLQGLRVTAKAVELVFVGFRAAVLTAVEIGAVAIDKLIDQVIDKANVAIDALNKLPKVNIGRLEPREASDFVEFIQDLGADAREAIGEVRGELHDLAMQEMPSAKFERFLEDVRKRSDAAAEAAARVNEQFRAGSGEATPAGLGGEDEEDEAERRRHEAALERLRERVMSETEILAKRHAEELEELAAHNEAKRLIDEEYYALREELEATHQEEMKALRERAMTDAERFESMNLRGRLQTVTAGLAKMTAGVSQHNETLFRLNKAAALSEAMIALPKAVLDSYKNAGGYPWGVAPAAAMAATGKAQIDAIRSTSFAGGGARAAPSVAGTTSAPAVSDVGSGGGVRDRVFRVQGLGPSDLFTGTAIRGLLEALQDELDDGGRLVFG